MQKQNDSQSEKRHPMAVRVLTSCAIFVALSVVIARLPMPNVTTRYSIEAVPYFLAGMLFGPVPGALVGAAADFIGALISGYGFNPIFCVPPIMYGLIAGLLGDFVRAKPTVFRIGLAFLPSVVLGSVLYQSFALAFVYGGEAFTSFFLTKLATRSVQFAVTWIIDTAVVWILVKSGVFEKAHLMKRSAARS